MAKGQSGEGRAIQINTHRDVLRHTARLWGVPAGVPIVMTLTRLVLILGTDLDATVRVGYVSGFSLCVPAGISATLSGALSYRSALVMRELTLTRIELARISQTDQLTGLLNRRGFDDAAVPALASARDAGVSVVIFMCDIDHFKSINDRFGHEAGDKVLVGMADVLRRFARKDGVLVARYGGEEFAALMIGTSGDQAEQYAEEIRKACGTKEILIRQGPERVTISIGFTVSRRDGELAQMMRIAHHAPYAA